MLERSVQKLVTFPKIVGYSTGFFIMKHWRRLINVSVLHCLIKKMYLISDYLCEYYNLNCSIYTNLIGFCYIIC